MLKRRETPTNLLRVKWVEELIAALAPPVCLACRRPLAAAEVRLCTTCVRALPWLRHVCPYCGLPRHRRGGCPAAGAAYVRAWAPVAYEGVARDLVRALKFRGALPAVEVMAAHIAASLPAEFRHPAAVLVPVPGVPARRRARGFDPARRLAHALAPRVELPVAHSLVRAGRASRQVGASRSARRAPGRIVVRVRGSPPPLAVLVDDVHTTGATLDACARALARAGCEVLGAVSYARTL